MFDSSFHPSSSPRRDSPDFDARHDLALLSAAYLRRMSSQRRNALFGAIIEASALWQNNHRYCSAQSIRAYFNRIKRYQKERDVLQRNARDMVALAQAVVQEGEARWHAPNTPTR